MQWGKVEVREDIVFGTGGGRDLRCDLYAPSEMSSGHGGVILVHGGRWRSGDKKQLGGYGLFLAQAGYLCVATEYRLLDEAPWPAQLHDVKAALRWFRANAADLGVDPAHIAIEGNSAGGQLALFAAGTANALDLEGSGGHEGVDTSLSAVIAVYPPTRFSLGPRQHGAVPIEVLLERPTAVLAEQASPVNLVTQSYPPTMLVHGTGDKVVPVSASLVMYESLTRHRVPADLHLFAEAAHGFDADLSFGRRTADLMVLFLDRYIAPTPKPSLL